MTRINNSSSNNNSDLYNRSGRGTRSKTAKRLKHLLSPESNSAQSKAAKGRLPDTSSELTQPPPREFFAVVIPNNSLPTTRQLVGVVIPLRNPRQPA